MFPYIQKVTNLLKNRIVNIVCYRKLHYVKLRNTKVNNLDIKGFQQVKNISFLRRFKKPTVEKLKVKDNIPEQYELIYRNTMDTYLLLAQIFTTVSVVVVIAVSIYDSDYQKASFENWNVKPRSYDTDKLIFIFAFALINTLLQAMLYKLPLRIYNHPETNKYIMIFFGQLPFAKKRLYCKVHDIVKLEERGILPWNDSRYEFSSGRKMILIDSYFRKPIDLDIMLGYQKA